MKAKGFWLIFLFTAFVFAVQVSAAGAAVNVNDCTLCHGTMISSFDIPQMARTTQCAVCHGRAWHAQWRDPVTGRTTGAAYVPGVGYFRTPATVNAAAYELHPAHSGNNAYAGRVDCSYCHGVAACNSCHTQVTHVQHGASAFTAPVFKQANGTKNLLTGMSCALSQCHQKLPAIRKTNSDGSQLCVNCHPRFGTSAADSQGHTQAGIDSAHAVPAGDSLNVDGLSQPINCQGCHNSSLIVEHTNQNKDCLVCHSPASPIPAAVKSVVQNAKGDPSRRACTLCHFNAGVLAEPAGHPMYHNAAGSGNLKLVGGPHATCNTCHGKQELWPAILGMAKSNPKNYSCLDCHNVQYNLAPTHKAVFEGQETEITGLHSSCNVCHTPGTEAADRVGEIIGKLKAGSESYECTECHYGSKLNDAHNGVIDGNCTTTCHKAALIDEHLSNPVTQKNTLTCGTCHLSSESAVKSTISTKNTDCSACHFQAHNINFAARIPSDITLYPGYLWSAPQPAEIWAGEAWFPQNYAGGRLVISNRRPASEVNGSQVWEFYKQNLVSAGWTAPVTEPDVSAAFSAEFTKGQRKVTILFFAGDYSGAPSSVGQDYRMEVLYY